MYHQSTRRWAAPILAALWLSTSLLSGPAAIADPEGAPPPVPVQPAPIPNPVAPQPPELPAPFTQPLNSDTPIGQNPLPFTGQPPFLPPSFNPVNGSTVGVAKPIYINFQRPIADRQMAQDAIRISSNPPVPGKFYWMSDTQLRWRPIDFWPAGTVVNIDAAGTMSSFRVGDALGPVSQ